MPAACKRISNTEFKVIGGLKLESNIGLRISLNLGRTMHRQNALVKKEQIEG